MGKGFQSYMGKKKIHPESRENRTKVWIAEQRANLEKEKKDALLFQQQKEEDLFRNRALLGDEKARLGLSFMYDADAPPGLKKEETKKKEENLGKLEWQRKPREYSPYCDRTGREESPGRDQRRGRSRERRRRSRTRERRRSRGRTRDRSSRRSSRGRTRDRSTRRSSRGRTRDRSTAEAAREIVPPDGEQDYGKDRVPIFKEKDVDTYTGYGGYNPDDQNGQEQRNEEYED